MGVELTYMGFVFVVMEMFWNKIFVMVENIGNVKKTVIGHLKWWILCYVHYTSVKILRRK